MTVIANLRIPADSFELGRIMSLDEDSEIELSSIVPLGEQAVPLFSVYNDGQQSFVKRVDEHPSVESLRVVSTHDHETVYALDWNVERDVFFQGIRETKAHLLSASGTRELWDFELRFPDHDALGNFQEYCQNAHISLEVGRIYNPVRPDSGRWYGLTEMQRDTLVRAVEGGYYSIPRGISTQDLADAYGISDQAVTERLRRGIGKLIENTLMTAMEEPDEYELAR